MQVSLNLSAANMSKVVDMTQYQNANEQLILRCKRGDRKAQYEIYKLYAKAMYNVCLRITGDTLEAEDVLQEAFLIAFEKIETYRNEAAFGAWLKKIVVNAALNQVRKRRFQFSDINNNEDYEDESAHAVNDAEEMSYQAEQIRRAIAQLPDGFRIPIFLVFVRRL
jgi:RNA polymerase sigma factor, sigma-70 family